MGTPLNIDGRRRLAHRIIQSMIFDEGIFVGKEGGDPDNKWKPEVDDVALLWNLIRTTSNLKEELTLTYLSQYRLIPYFDIIEGEFKSSPWYISLSDRRVPEEMRR